MKATPRLAISIPDDDLKRIGLRAVSMIRDRTLRGVGADGAPFKPYSTQPFALPLGAITKRAQRALGDDMKIITSKRSGALWAVITGGYAALKDAAYPQYGGVVNLSRTGAMLRALTVIGVNGSGQVTIRIGFAREEEAQKALWNDARGRRILGFTQEERTDLAGAAARVIQIRT